MSEPINDGGPAFPKDIFEFVKSKIALTEKAITGREQGEATWKSGTDKSWREVGCKLNKTQRLELARIESKIASKLRVELEHYRTIDAMLVERTKEKV